MRRRLTLLAAVVGALLFLAAGAVAVVALHDRAPLSVAVGGPVLVTNSKGPDAMIEGHSTPSLAVDPADGRHLVLAERIDRPHFGCRAHVSTDEGVTWSQAAVPLPEGKDTCYIPDVVFDGTDVVLVYLTLNTHPKDPLSAGNDPNGMYLERSTDGGRSFGSPQALPGSDNLQPRLAVDRRDGRLYVVYVRGNHDQNDTPLGFGPPPNPIMAISSGDGGRSFSPPVQVSDPRRPRVGAPTPVVAPDGTLYVLYQDYKGDLDDYNNRAIPYRGTLAVVLARSSDRGSTFTQTLVDNNEVRPHPFLIYLPPFPSLTISPDGRRLYAAWSDARGGAPDVLLRRSDDGGARWAAPVQLDDRQRGKPANYEMPAILATGSNRLLAVYYAIAGSPARSEVLFQYSADGGQHFAAAIPISSEFDPAVGVPSLRYPGSVDLGSHLALATISASEVIAAWSDASDGTADTGRQDVQVARVRLE